MSAYIIEGENKAAVSDYVASFAKSFNCGTAERGGALFCGHCPSCRTFDSKNHPDVFFIKGTKQSGIGVDDIREQLVMPAALKPFKYGYKIFIVENAETLLPAAQNALLKTIEEPAPYGVFLFAAPNTHNFLPTVISRCMVKKIRGGDRAELPFNSPVKIIANKISDGLAGADTTAAFAIYQKLNQKADDMDKEKWLAVLDALYVHYGARSFEVTDEITRTKQIIKQNGNIQLAMELLFLKISTSEVLEC